MESLSEYAESVLVDAADCIYIYLDTHLENSQDLERTSLVLWYRCGPFCPDDSPQDQNFHQSHYRMYENPDYGGLYKNQHWQQQ